MVKNLPAIQETWVGIPGLGRSPWSRKWQRTPEFLPGEFHGQRSLAGYSAWGCKESDTTERTHTHTHTRGNNPSDRVNYLSIGKVLEKGLKRMPDVSGGAERSS